MRKVGTLRQIGARVGDVVGIHSEKYKVREYDNSISRSWTLECDNGVTFKQYGEDQDWRIIRRAARQFNTLTAEEKGDLIMAHVDEKIIEVSLDGGATWERCYTPLWVGSACYRVKPDVTERVSIRSSYPFAGWVSEEYGNIDDTHRITFQTVNGKPDCNSIRMEEL